MAKQPLERESEETAADDVDQALADAQASLNAVKQVAEGAAPATTVAVTTADAGDPVQVEQLVDPVTIDSGLAMLGDVELNVMIELGRTEMMVEDVLRLTAGAVVELDKLAGDPVDVYVNGRLIARGEVLVLNDNFCVRVSEIVADLEEQAEAAAQAELADDGDGQPTAAKVAGSKSG